MSLIFVDTSALFALGNKQDDLHDKAKNIRNALIQAHQSFITTNAILLELCNTFSALNLRNGAIQLVTAIRQSPTWYCVAIDPLMDAGIELFKQRLDKEWSLVDCQSILVAQTYKITDIFTHDHHFEQAGFNILLK